VKLVDVRTPAARLALTAAVLATLLVYSRHDIARYVQGWRDAPRPVAPSSPQAADDRLVAKLELLGASPVNRFGFDPDTPDRVVACNGLSVDGGRSWTPLPLVSGRPAIVLGGRTQVAPVVTAGGRLFCGDLILGSGEINAELGDIQPAVEWDGLGWLVPALLVFPQPVSLPGRPGSDIRRVIALAHVPDVGVLVARGTHVVTTGGAYAVPGELKAFVADAKGGGYAVVQPPATRRMFVSTSRLGEPWTTIESPGDVELLAASGDRVYAAADMLGRLQRGLWAWTRWPPTFQPRGLTALGETVVAWGFNVPAGYHPGALAVSRDGGATMRMAVVKGFQPAWVAIDPHRPSELLAADPEGQLARIRLVR
jgi:hypothetical protein